mgnify:CR=1 FL=1
MQTTELKGWLEDGRMRRVVVFERAPSLWEIWAYGDALPDHVGNVIYEGQRRMTWATAADARRWLQGVGWTGPVTEEPRTMLGCRQDCLMVA